MVYWVLVSGTKGGMMFQLGKGAVYFGNSSWHVCDQIVVEEIYPFLHPPINVKHYEHNGSMILNFVWALLTKPHHICRHGSEIQIFFGHPDLHFLKERVCVSVSALFSVAGPFAFRKPFLGRRKSAQSRQ